MAVHDSIESYIERAARTPFSWAENNCMSFVVGYLADHRVPLEWFQGHRTARACFVAYRRKASELGFANLAEMFDTILEPELTFYPRDGFVAARPVDDPFGYAYGLCYAQKVYFFSAQDRSLVATPPESVDMYWSIP